MTTRYEQVADDLRRLIANGTYQVGTRLPPESRLSAHYGVSTPTLRDALEVLRTEGLVAKFQGRGNFVSAPPERITYLAVLNGAHTRLSSAATVATPHLASRLGTSPGAPLTEYVCLAHRDDDLYVLAHVYVPRAHELASAAATPWGDDLLTAAGVPVTTSTDQATARFPTSAEAQSLRIGTRTPVLAIERTFADGHGHVLGYALLVLPGDRATVALTTPITPDQKAHP
ncbi:GntR family transcriptional regulator [Streptomyces sp. NPDC021020]|uniref:GntR family transcriptional regulator n=1 Tax=Streptomyces sp. NPDC021020 TaxID=3365109 RepID=UPI00379123E0